MKSLIGHRGRAIIRIGSWSLIAKICAAANLFGSFPFVLAALDGPQFGLWATLVSLISFSAFLDFGFANGTMNLAAAAHGRGAHSEVAAIIDESRRTLVVVAGVVLTIFAAALLLVPWHHLLGSSKPLSIESEAAMAVVLIAIGLSIPLNLGNRVQLALGRGDRGFRWQAIGQLAALLAVVIASRYAPSLLALTVAAVITPLLASLGNTIEIMSDPQLRIAESTTNIPRSAIRKSIGREGALFFGLQLAAAVSFSADLVLISALLGPAEAGTYAIVQRLFSIIPLTLSLAWAPLWPIYRQALAARDHAWVERTLRRSVILAAIFAGICATAICLGYEPLLRTIAPATPTASTLLIIGFAMWSILEASGTAVATFLNSASIFRFQLMTAAAFALVCFTGKVWVVQQGNINWIPWVAVITYCVTWVVPALICWPSIRGTISSRAY